MSFVFTITGIILPGALIFFLEWFKDAKNGANFAKPAGLKAMIGITISAMAAWVIWLGIYLVQNHLIHIPWL